MTLPIGSAFVSEDTLAAALLRSSPIICVFDSLSLLVEIITLLIRGAPFLKAVSVAIGVRLPRQGAFHQHAEDPSRRQALVALIVFILGTLTQAPKLLATSGVPWTRAWACMYLASFVVLGLALLYSRDQQRARDAEEALPEEPIPQHAIVATIAGLLHVALIIWAVHNLAFPVLPALVRMAEPKSLEETTWLSVMGCFVVAILTFILLALVWVLLLYFVGLILTVIFGTLGDDSHTVIQIVVLVVITVIYYCLALWFLYTQEPPYDHSPLLQRFYLVYLEGVAVAAVGLAIRACYLHLHIMSIYFIFFVLNIIVSLLWYGLRYQPSGTYRPDWTNIALG
jgi:hypothetical protein